MNKYFLKTYIFILLLTFNTLFGQSAEYLELSERKGLIYELEAFGGPTLSFLRGNLEVDNNTQNKRKIKIGYSLGVGLTNKLGKSFEIMLGLVFEKKGGKSHSTTTYFDELDQTFKQGTIEFNYDYKYFTIPIQVYYLFGKQDQFSCGLGPYISHLNKQTLKRTPLFKGSVGLTDETDRNTKFDFGITASLTFKIPINSRLSIRCQVLNTLGLLNIRPDLYDGQTMKNNNTSFLIGFITKR